MFSNQGVAYHSEDIDAVGLKTTMETGERLPVKTELQLAFKILKGKFGQHQFVAEALGIPCNVYTRLRSGWQRISTEREKRILSLALEREYP